MKNKWKTPIISGAITLVALTAALAINFGLIVTPFSVLVNSAAAVLAVGGPSVVCVVTTALSLDKSYQNKIIENQVSLGVIEKFNDFSEQKTSIASVTKNTVNSNIKTEVDEIVLNN